MSFENSLLIGASDEMPGVPDEGGFGEKRTRDADTKIEHFTGTEQDQEFEHERLDQ